MKKRYEQVDIMRGILIILMVMGHVHFGSVFNQYIHMFHMPAWFFITGWFYHKKRESFLEFIKRKSRKLLLPYFFCGVVHYPLWILLVRENHESIRTPITSLLWVNTDNQLPIANALWFLTCLFFAELLFEGICRVCKDSQLSYICIGIAITGCLLPALTGIRLPWGIDTAMVGCGLIAIGYRFSMYRETRVVQWLLNMRLPIWGAGLLVNAVLCFANSTVNMRTGHYGIIPLFWLNSLLAIVLYWNLGNYLNVWYGKKSYGRIVVERLKKIGRNSIAYLCWNQLAILSCKLLLKNTIIATIPSIYFKLLVLCMTLFFLYGAENIHEMAFKREFQHSNSSKHVKRAVYYTGVLILVLTTCIALKMQAKQHEYDSIVVTTPQIPNNSTLYGYAEEKELRRVLYDNVCYLSDVQWNTPNLYAYCRSSSLLKAKKPDILRSTLIHMSNHSFRQWEKQKKVYVVNTKEGMSCEQAIRPWAHTCFVMANAIRFGIAEDREQELTKKAILLVESLAESHMMNTRTGWGNSWQSAEWAENIGYAAWLLWDELSADGRYHVYRMVKYEADRFLNYDIPYYQNQYGEVVYDGDTKAEENAWNSRILALAVCMFPEEPNCQKWENRMKELLLSSGAAPSDVDSDRDVDGFILSDVLKGSNINEDGSVVNHNRIHIDYIATTMEGMLDTAIIYAIAGKCIPESSIFGFDRMYDALVNIDLGMYDDKKTGHHFFERNNGMVTSSVNMPGENDWGGNWYPEYYLVDTAADLFELDNSFDANLKARNWAEVHLQVLSAMSARVSGQKHKGQFFIEGENHFISGETYQMHCLSKAYLLRVLNQEGILCFNSSRRLTNE